MAGLLFYSFVVMGMLLLLNMLLAIVCDAFADVKGNQTEEDLNFYLHLRDRLRAKAGGVLRTSPRLTLNLLLLLLLLVLLILLLLILPLLLLLLLLLLLILPVLLLLLLRMSVSTLKVSHARLADLGYFECFFSMTLKPSTLNPKP